MIKLKLTYFFFLLSLLSFSQNKSENIYNEIKVLRVKSQNEDFSNSKREQFALKAVSLSKKTNQDSTVILSSRNLAFLYLNIDEYEKYREVNYTNLKLSQKANDSLSLAVAQQNLGYYYDYNILNDSAYYYYYNSSKIFSSLNEKTRLAFVLSNMINIQEMEKDYVGAEANAIRALKLYNELPETENNLESQWTLYNILGVISGELNQYNEALNYHDKAIRIAEKMQEGVYNKLYSLNNKAEIYKLKEEYNTAISFYQSVIKTKGLFTYDPSFYASLINNIADARLLAKDKNLNAINLQLRRALKICDSINDKVVIPDININLSELHKVKGNSDSAFYYSNEALKLSKEIGDNKSTLKSLKLLSQNSKGEKGKKYLYDYIKLNDSLINKERAASNKFAKIRYETDEIKAENQVISRRNQWLLGILAGLLLTSFLVYTIITQRAKNRELQFVQKQQVANEEIYNLMLAQQDKVEEGRVQEKKRISEELHDGILSRLFGTRLSLDSINMVNTDEAVKTRSNYIKELQTIEQEIRKISHDLNQDFIANSGFIDIVETLIENQTKAYQLTYDFNTDDEIDWDELSNKNKIHLYRIVQETLQNIYKHAKAKHVKISFQLKKDVILVTISDDGSGFDVNKAKKGIGIKNINSRVAELNGKLHIDSQIGNGTTIAIEIPT